MQGMGFGVCVDVDAVGRYDTQEDRADYDGPTYVTPSCDTCSIIAAHARIEYGTQYRDMAHCGFYFS